LTAVARDTSNLTTTSAPISVTVSNTDTTPPTVAITAPAANATVSGSVTITATASDNVAVAGVQFKVDGANIGAEVTGTSPYSVTWNTTGVSAGTHTLTAVARDTSNLTTTSAPISVTVSNADTTPPTVNITAPAASATVSGSVTITATATDNVAVAGVQFKVDGTNIGAEVTGPSPYSVTWNTTGVTNGSHTLTAVARDTSNLTTTSAPVAVTVNNAGGTATIQFVQGNYAVPQTPPTVVNVSFPGAQGVGNLNVVAVGWNDSTATVTSVTDSRGNAYSLAAGPTVMAGKATHAIYYARNIVAAGAGANVVTVRFNVAASFPDVRVLEYRGLDPVNPLIGGVGWTGTGTAADSWPLTVGTSNVLLVGANVVETSTSAPGANFTGRMITSPNGDLAEDQVVMAPGSYRATATTFGGYWVMQMAAFAAAGGGTGSDTTPPTVAITAPAANATVSGSVTITATATDNVAVAGVQFKVDGANIGAEVTGASPYSVTWNTTGVSAGPHTLTAVARDTSNLTTTSAPISVTVSNVDTTPPTVTITSPSANTTVGGVVTVTATATDNVAVAGVQFKVDGANLGAEVTGTSPYSVTWNTTGASAGPHTLTAVARDTSNLTTTSAPVSVTVNNSDTTAPTVAVTAPLPNADLAGTVTLAAIASDDVGVLGVQFKVDGVNVGAEVTTKPYFTTWDTTTVADGPHTITAVARDMSQATTSNPVNVTVSNATATAPSRIGQWSAEANWPIVAVHVTLLPNGTVLAWDGADQHAAARVWTPSSNNFTSASPPDNIFCAGHALLSDGRVFVVGGHIQNFAGLADANFFNPSNRQWSSAPPMVYPRWYPTATTLPDGRVLVTSGAIDCSDCIAEIPEIYNPATNAWSQLPNAALALPLYPHLFVQPDGRVLATGAFEGTMAAVELDLAAGTWSVVDSNVVDGHSSVMYQLGKVMKSGTAANSDPPFTTSQPTTYVLDMSDAQPRWRQTPPMAFGRSYHTLTSLPDGTVLVTGGGQSTDTFDEDNAVLAAESWSPVTETYTMMASMSVPRLYHSTALLLPDGRVLVAGGGRFGNGAGDIHDKLNAQLYSPPYLFKGARPTISSAPTLLSYGANISVSSPDAARIASVAFIPLGTVTHHFNQSQRFLRLPFQPVGTTLTVQTPNNANEAPPGYYMLFIVDDTGVPSVASIVKIQ
jgi:hypothetical protein